MPTPCRRRAPIGAPIRALHHVGLISFDNPTRDTWLARLGLSLVLGTGQIWSRIRRKPSAPSDMDDMDERHLSGVSAGRVHGRG